MLPSKAELGNPERVWLHATLTKLMISRVVLNYGHIIRIKIRALHRTRIVFYTQILALWSG